MSCNIYVVYHIPGAYRKSEVYFPIAVGNKKEEMPTSFLRDDEGENIAYKNDSYNELTALYRIWKDEKLIGEAVGLAHYRRYLGVGLPETHYLYRSTERAMRKIRKTEKAWAELPSDVDLVAPYPAQHRSVADYYALAHGKTDLPILLSVIEKYHPDYYDCAKRYLNGHDDYLCNLFVMKEDLFRRYAEWLFDVVEKFVEEKGDNGRLYVSERLTGVFIQKMIEEGKNVRFAPIVTIEPRESIKVALKKVRLSGEKGKQKWKPLVHALIPTALWRRYYRKTYEKR